MYFMIHELLIIPNYDGIRLTKLGNLSVQNLACEFCFDRGWGIPPYELDSLIEC